MKKWVSFFALLSIFLLAGCAEDLRYGDQINSQNHIDASRTQNEIVNDILRNANPIMSMLMNSNGNAFSTSKLEGLLTQEMERVQLAIGELESYRQPDALKDETKQTFEALVNYKSALFFLREKVRSGENPEAEIEQFIEAINYLQSSFYVKP